MITFKNPYYGDGTFIESFKHKLQLNVLLVDVIDPVLDQGAALLTIARINLTTVCGFD